MNLGMLAKALAVLGYRRDSGKTVAIGSDVTITAANAQAYNGQVLEFTGAYTVTLSAGLPAGFCFAGIPPASGNATIASDGVVLIDGATTAITRATTAGRLFAILARGSAADAYVSTGS